nr:RNA-directed DNA polymerase, eukaryota [Tanacetum cinerariifolium]
IESRDTFLKIGKNWKESMDSEENLVSSFARKRLCIKTKWPDNILEKFKITHRGKVHLAHAEELFAWTSIFLDCKVPEYISDDDDVLHSASNNSVGPQQGGDDLVVDSEVEGVLDTIFDDNLASPVNSVFQSEVNESDPSLSHPPGFTLEASRQVDDPIGECIDTGFVKESSPSVHSKVMNNSEEVHVKELGNSGGILCIWEASMFKKAYVTVSDNFIAIYETWISNNSKCTCFNRFIEASGLVDVKLKGYSFTWSHPSASKMSKLDRFLVSEVFTEFGLTPFRLYHSWFKMDGLMLWWNMLGISSLIWTVTGAAKSIKENLTDIDKNLDRGNVSDELLLKRMDFTRQLLEIKQMEAKDWVQKSKIKWAIEGDENSKYFHGQGRFKLNFLFPNRLSNNQVANLDRYISHDEIRGAVWNYGVNKSHGLDGFTFEFFRIYWSFIGADFCSAIDCFFESGNIPMGSNASFIALIPEVTDAKFVTDFKPISLIECVYKVVTKIIANRLAMVITDLKQAMIFKVDFAKAYDSVRWDYLLDVLHAFGFGPNWCKWIRGLVDVKLKGYSFTWSHPSASKMSKLDRFLVSEGIILLFPSISALCLDGHLSDHRPILLREVFTDFGPTLFRLYHSWLKMDGFDAMVEHAWNSFSHLDSAAKSIKDNQTDIDKNLDRGNVFDELLLKRMDFTRQLLEIKQMEAKDWVQKSKIK